ncbi:MAG TPA: hypothetical protein VGE35_04160 [Candidatus Paceibacterota bacterium]
MKTELKVKAVAMRREGKTYSEIRKVVPVAKSTLSLWFHEVELATHQKQRITQKRIDGQKKGAEARRGQRILAQETIWSESERQVGNLSARELWLVGIALYWAEGTKEKESKPGKGVIFTNSDPSMIRVFIVWAKKFGQVSMGDMRIDLYIHESKRHEVPLAVDFWSRELRVPKSVIKGVYFKKNKINTTRKNTGGLYNGLLRVSISRSSTLLRKIEGWSKGIGNNCRVV